MLVTHLFDLLWSELPLAFRCFQKFTAKFWSLLNRFKISKFWTWRWRTLKKSISQIPSCQCCLCLSLNKHQLISLLDWRGWRLSGAYLGIMSMVNEVFYFDMTCHDVNHTQTKGRTRRGGSWTQGRTLMSGHCVISKKKVWLFNKWFSSNHERSDRQTDSPISR